MEIPALVPQKFSGFMFFLSKKRFVGVTEKYLKTEESLNTYDGKLSERN